MVHVLVLRFLFFTLSFLWKDVVALPISVIDVLWTYLRAFFRFFGEGVFCYSLFAISSKRSRVGGKFGFYDGRDMLAFVSMYAMVSVVPFAAFHDEAFYRLATVVAMFLYFWNKEQKCGGGKYGVLGWKCILTVAVFLVLALEFAFSLCHTLLHMSCVWLGVYNAVKGDWFLYGLYRSLFVVLHLCALFLISKLRFFKISDMKIMASRKWVLVSFSFCLLSIVYIRYNYVVFRDMSSLAPYCDIFLWILAFMMPAYVGFYMAMSELTKLLSVKANCAADDNIFVWIFNPSMIETIHLNIYDSELFMPSFEANRLAFKKKLERLGIDNGYKGYSELVFCLILTKLFIGMKGWSFERDIFGQASVVIDVPFPEVKKNIEDVIARTWLIDDAETLIDGYYLPCCGMDMYDQQQRPSAEEFLMQMAKSV